MGLTTIDGKLYIDYDSLNYLLAVKNSEDESERICKQIQDIKQKYYGSGGSMPKEMVLKALQLISERDMAYGYSSEQFAGDTLLCPQPGEEDIEGNLYTEGVEGYNHVNLSPIGGASVVGKVMREAARRIKQEMAADWRQRETVYCPRTKTDVLQAEPENE